MRNKGEVIILGLVAAFALGGAYKTADTDGKSLFLSNKCQSCHTLKAEGITGNEASTVKPSGIPDLSGVGLKHDADWIARYIMKQEEINDDKHPKKFKGSDEELMILSIWLASHKQQ